MLADLKTMVESKKVYGRRTEAETYIGNHNDRIQVLFLLKIVTKFTPVYFIVGFANDDPFIRFK